MPVLRSPDEFANVIKVDALVTVRCLDSNHTADSHRTALSN